MLKMEPNDATAVRNPTCLCSQPATANTITSANDIITGNCVNCSTVTSCNSIMPASSHHPVIDTMTDDENDDDDNSNILIGQFSQFNNNYEPCDDDDSATKLDNNNRDCAIGRNSTANMNSLNLHSKPNVICDNLNHFASDCYSANDSALKSSPLVGCKTLDNINMVMISATNYKKTINGNNTLTTGSALQNSVEQAIAARVAACVQHNVNNNNRSVQQDERNSLSESSEAARSGQMESSGE